MRLTRSRCARLRNALTKRGCALDNRRFSLLRWKDLPVTALLDDESWRDTLAGTRQSARSLRSGRRTAAGGHRPHFRIRSCAGHRNSGQRQDSHADFAVLVRSADGPCSQSSDHGRCERVPCRAAALCRPAGRPLDAGEARGDVSRGVRGARLPGRIGLEGVPGHRERSAAFRFPPGLQDGSRLPEPLFTPATKSQDGAHDENISFEATEALLGASDAAELRRLTLAIYRKAAAHAESCGLILADTKFEFGKNGRRDYPCR